MENRSRRRTDGLDFKLVEVGSRLGVPLVVLLLVLTQLTPRIDRGIQIADRVDSRLDLVLAACAAPR